jgi:hypothetical protein
MAAACLAAIGAAVIAFIEPRWQSERPSTESTLVEMPKLGRSEYAFVNEPGSPQDSPTQVLFVRRPDGQVDAWRVPGRNGLVQLPDVRGWRQGPLCQRFAPDFTKGRIGCWDGSLGESTGKYYEWDLDGKNVIGQIDDMRRAQGYAQARR